MAGTKEGGLKASKTNKEIYGDNFYREIGKKGGMAGHTGGFAANPALARVAGAKGGRISKRGEANKTREMIRQNYGKITEMIQNGKSVKDIAKETGIPASTLYKKIRESVWG